MKIHSSVVYPGGIARSPPAVSDFLSPRTIINFNDLRLYPAGNLIRRRETIRFAASPAVAVRFPRGPENRPRKIALLFISRREEEGYHRGMVGPAASRIGAGTISPKM